MKVGDYVRFKTLSREIKIGKVIDIIEPDKDSMKKYCVYDLDNNEATVDDYIIKSSSNLTDLIEVGDYVNGYKVSFVDEEPVMGKFVQCDYEVSFGTTNHYRFYEADIKSIVTKEQFEAIKYEIK